MLLFFFVDPTMSYYVFRPVVSYLNPNMYLNLASAVSFYDKPGLNRNLLPKIKPHLKPNLKLKLFKTKNKTKRPKYKSKRMAELEPWS